MKRTSLTIHALALALLAVPPALDAQVTVTRDARATATTVSTNIASAVQAATSITTSVDVASAIALAQSIAPQAMAIASQSASIVAQAAPHAARATAATSHALSDLSFTLPLALEIALQSDSLMRAAQRTLQDGDFREAARMYARIAEDYPRSAQAPDALYWRAFALYRAGNSSNLSAALEALNDLNRRYPTSSANRGDAGSLRQRVCGELARRGDEACAREVVSTATSTSASPSASSSQGSGQSCPREDDDNDERIMALNALLNMNSEAAVPILEKVLARRDECSRGLRKKAVFLISQKRTDNVVDVLMKTAREDPSPEVREQAVFWLSNVRDPRVVDLLAEMAMNASDPAIQEKAIFSLSNTRSERASQVLRDIAQREGASKRAREQAIFWLGNRRDGDAASFLRGLYGRVTDKDLKERVLFSIANQRGTGSGEWLISIAMNERETIELRKQALFWAANQRAATLADITGLYDRIGDREMKEQIIFVLSQNKADGAVDKLMDIARRDSDRELRSKAIFWLGQSRDPRVIRFLEEVINR
ncbi:MAG TPA: HEAT repeat domain-containing protein [Gemmatimonadaceae bacterium]